MSVADRRAAKTGAHDQVAALLARDPSSRPRQPCQRDLGVPARNTKVVASLRRGQVTLQGWSAMGNALKSHVNEPSFDVVHPVSRRPVVATTSNADLPGLTGKKIALVWDSSSAATMCSV